MTESSTHRNQSGADSGQEMNKAIGLRDKGEPESVANVRLSGASADNAVGPSCFRFFTFGMFGRTAMGGMRDVPCGVHGTSLMLRVGVTAQ